MNENERHVRSIVRDIAPRYNRGRPHTALGPGFPVPRSPRAVAQIREWLGHVPYFGSVNWYLPARMVTPVAITATILGIVFGLALLAGFQIRNAALDSAGSLTLFAPAMFSGDPKSPFDHPAFTAARGASTLAAFTTLTGSSV